MQKGTFLSALAIGTVGFSIAATAAAAPTPMTPPVDTFEEVSSGHLHPDGNWHVHGAASSTGVGAGPVTVTVDVDDPPGDEPIDDVVDIDGVPALDRGDSVFWDGDYVESGEVRSAELCDIAGPCFTWDLELTEPGTRLRVGIDTPSREDTFRIGIIGPGGAELATVQNGNQFNAEAFVADPVAGTYVIEVRAVHVTHATFRMRAKLEGAAKKSPKKPVALLPNLQVVPPTEFGFAAPITPNGPYPPDATNPPASVGGNDLYSCTPDELAPVEVGGAGAVDCLRLTSGPMNVGAGPFDLRFTFIDDMVDGTADPYYLRGPVFQAVHYSDGTTEMRPGGTYIFHTTHTHFHDENILSYDLFEVTDAERGKYLPVGSGTKSGFCPADQLFGDWFSFAQQVRGYFGEGDTPTGNCFSPNDGLLGLTSGWGDVYRWQRPGQYVEFDGNGDGLFVVQSTVDAENNILEEDETDNTSYALIRIVGRQIDIVERGRGTSPWDRDKVVYEGDGPASYE